MIQVELKLNEQQAWAFAEFLKRVGYGHYRALAASDEETHDMVHAGEKVRAALEEKGYAPH
jgi:hypothetical protein